MTNQNMHSAIRKIAWGFVLIHTHVYIGSLDLLPDWAGYLLFLAALPILGEREESAKLLIPLSKVIAAYSGICWISKGFLGKELSLEIITIFASVLILYFHFQLLTNVANIAKKYNSEKEKMILHLRTANTILITFYTVIGRFAQIEIIQVIMSAFAYIWVGIVILICVALFSLGKEIGQSEVMEQ